MFTNLLETFAFVVDPGIGWKTEYEWTKKYTSFWKMCLVSQTATLSVQLNRWTTAVFILENALFLQTASSDAQQQSTEVKNEAENETSATEQVSTEVGSQADNETSATHRLSQYSKYFF